MSDAMEYISRREIPQLFECLMTALMYHRPADHLTFIQESIEKVKSHGIVSVRWDLFLEDGSIKGKAPALPPVTPPGSSRASSRAGSRTDFPAEKKPPLPPIGGAGPSPAAERRTAEPLACPVVLVLGGPGSGRRQVCQALASRYGFRTVSMGDLVRASEASKAALAANSGRLPNGAALALLTGALEALSPDCKGVFIEGYPRSETQLADLLGQVRSIEHALLIDFDEVTLRRRLERLMSPAEATARLEDFRAQTLPLCRHLDDDGKLLLLPVDGEPSGKLGGSDGDVTILAEATALLDPVLKPIEAPIPAGPLIFIRSLATDPLVTARAEARNPNPPSCPLVLVFGGPGSRRSDLTRRLAQDVAGCVWVDVHGPAVGRSYEVGPIEVSAVTRLLARHEGADLKKPPRCILVSGYPTCEAELRDFCASLGRPELALLVDCQETDMLGRLMLAGMEPREAGREMRYFKEETLPVVRHLDVAGKLAVFSGDRDDAALLYDLKSAMDFVLHDRWPMRPDDEDRIRRQPALLDAAARLKLGGH